MDLAQAIDLAPLVGYGLEALAGMLLAVATWAIHKYGKKLGLEQDDKVRGYLLNAVENAVDFGLNKARTELNDSNWTKIEVKNATLQNGAEYVLKRVPDAVKRFNLDEDGIKDLVLAKLEQRPLQLTKGE